MIKTKQRKGVTLVELLIVVLILAALYAIAVLRVHIQQCQQCKTESLRYKRGFNQYRD